MSLGASAGVAVGGVTFAVYSYNRLNAQLGPGQLQIMGDPGALIGTNDCGKSYQAILDDSNPKVVSLNYDALQNACTSRSRIYIGYIIGGLGMVGAVVSLIMLTRDTEPPDTPAAGTHGKKPAVAIAPIVTPGGGGASLSLTW